MFGLLALLGATAYVHHAVDEITRTFIEIRVAEAKFFSKLVQDNWDGIKSVPNDKKEILMRNLDPEFAGTDLRTMRDLMLFVFYCFMGTIVIDRIRVTYRTWKAARSAKDAL